MLKTRLLAATALAVGVTMLPATAFAQVPATPDGGKVAQDSATPLSDAADDTVTRPKNTTNTNDEDGDIVVVGSRIRRASNYNSSEPITVITREEATLAGFNSTTDALQSTGVTGGAAQINNAFGGFVTNGGPGANTLSLRGLGAERTLVLLNGRRVAPAGSRGSVGSADLNVLPTSMIDRVEILKSGASSVYGSDAVGGVVNIITRNKVDGLTLEGQHNITQDGGGESRRYSAVAGFNSDRFHVSGSIEYLRREELTLGDRDFTRCQTDYRRTAANRTPGSGDFIDPLTGRSKCYPITGTGDNGVTINTISLSTLNALGNPTVLVPAVGAAGSVGTAFNRFRPNAAVTTGVVGFEGVGGGANNLNVRDTLDPRIYNTSLISPVEIFTGYLQGSYETEVLGGAEIYGELLLNRRKSSQVGFRQLSLDYIKGSPLIPANLQFSTVGLPGFSLSNPTATVGVRAFIGLGNYNSNQEVDFAKAGGGVRGDFNLLSGWRYDAYFSRTWSDSTYTSDQVLADRLGNSLQVVSNGSGGFNCANPVGGCVAAPALTPAVIGGNLPAAFVNYIQVPDTGSTKFRETVVNVAFNGPLFNLPGGPAQMVIGGEFRRSTIDDTPSVNSQSGNLYNFSASLPTRGSDQVYEAFGELELPLIRNVAGIYDLTLSGSARYTHYRSYGGQETYKLGGVYSPFRALSIRGSYGTSYRAPALFEQFLGATSGFLNQSGDPCNNYDAPDVNPTRATNCASEGLPAGFQANTGIRNLAGGGAATGLGAETSRSWTAGAVFQPKLGSFGDISLAADYFDTTVKNGVARAGAGAILQLCYDDPQFRSGGGFCNLVSRNASTGALTVNDNYVNLSEDNVRGIDITGRYSIKVSNDTTFRLGAQLTKYFEQSNRLFETDPLDEYNGSLNTPEWTGTFEAAIQSKGFLLRYGLEWIKGTESYTLYGLNSATTPFYLEVPDYYLHSLSAQIPAGDRFGLTVGVRNLLDKEPPQISSGVYNRVGNAPLYSGYDYLGRQFFVNVSAKF
ncbi:TonB-dependent receptor [Sphingomonas aliaeris]|uniref:TonB-dependent receptor n=1 Tax=Sphingomonas aliaeris TaxID=2759526 RepID=A0A974S518_9SPHN|nr:TonB-dependent receptor [Sphingomonas aliaeris]QQV78084.1 TonB-dependent receptor [Sphingomonas aliaeris]